ncbi:MAG: histidine phosphatase family protein [Desulforhopalus sp.]|jgi:broad specificity phosphatase PhoE|nr:histidine phosphatase family protein [Desulforhopalus sp.]
MSHVVTGLESAKNLILLRHGDCGSAGRYLGSTELTLSEKGVQQIQGCAATLAETAIDQVYCSPMLRCRKSLELLDLPAPVEIVSDLREIDFGRWEGKTFAEIAAADSRLVDAWAQNEDAFSFPGGEKISQFRDRVDGFIKTLSHSRCQAVLVVSHGGVIRHLLCRLLDLAWQHYLLFDVQPGRFATVAWFPGGAVLSGLNLGGRQWPESP